ncbi:MAG: hypothetical protein WC364_12160 [Eubacteriales bacterium]
MISAFLFAFRLWLEGGITKAIYPLLAAITVCAIAMVSLKNNYTVIKGFPMEDERTKKVKMYAAGYAYYISLYIWLALEFLRNNNYINQSQIFVLGMVGMAVSFVISWLFLNKQENI